MEEENSVAANAVDSEENSVAVNGDSAVTVEVNVADSVETVAVNVVECEVTVVVNVVECVVVAAKVDLLMIVHLSRKLLIAVSVLNVEVAEVEIAEVQEDVVETAVATEEKDVSMTEWTLK